MKYALLIYGEKSWQQLSDEEKAAAETEYFAIGEQAGTFGGAQLQPTAATTTVRVEGEQALLTDGPFIEAKEYLGGFYLFEAENLDAAVEVAARIPAARQGGAVEVRPLVER